MEGFKISKQTLSLQHCIHNMTGVCVLKEEIADKSIPKIA